MAGLSPFERAFNPPGPTQEPSLFGWIGGLMGNRSNEERASDASAQALQDLSQRVQQGASPQQAVIDWLATPQGRDLFAQGAASDVITKWQSQINQTPTVSSIPPGQTPVVNTPGKQPQIGQPTLTEAQSTNRTMPQVGQVGAGSTPYVVPPTGQGGGSVQFQPQTPTEAQGTARTEPVVANVPPGYTQTVKAPGSQTFAPANRTPTEQNQNFDYFKEIAQLPADQLKQIAQWQMMPQDQRDTEGKRMVDAAVKNGSMDQRTADLLKTGYFGPTGPIRIQTAKNATGDEVGYTVLDLRDPGNSRFIPGIGFGRRAVEGAAPEGSPAAVIGGAPSSPGATPAAPAAPASGGAAVQPPTTGGPQAVPPGPQSSKLTMFFGAGALPSLTAGVGSLLRQIDPRISIDAGEVSANNIRNLNTLQTTLVQMAKTGEGMGIPIQYINSLKSLGPDSGWLNDPKTAINHAIDLAVLSHSNMSKDMRIMNDFQASTTERKEAEKRVQAYGQVLDAMPPIADMVNLRGDMERYGPVTQTQSITPARAIKSIAGGAKEGATAGRNIASEVVGQPAQQAPAKAAGRFSKLDNDAFLGVDPNRLPPDLMTEYLAEVKRRATKFGKQK